MMQILWLLASVTGAVLGVPEGGSFGIHRMISRHGKNQDTPASNDVILGESEKSCMASLANVLEENARLKKDFKDFYEKLEMDKEIKTEMGNLSLECKVIEPKAILISGGWSDSGHRSVEALRSDGTPLCKLADLPDNRRVHTMDGPISCGGARTMTTCLIYEKGEWTKFSSNLNYKREDHVSWKRPNSDSVQLLGGEQSPKTSEIVTSSHVTRGFDLKHRIDDACGFGHDDVFIITGGRWTMRTVSKYNEDGWVEDMPTLNDGRRYHGCGHYISDNNDLYYLVAGGYGYGDSYLKTTEIMSAFPNPESRSKWGTQRWWFAENLPSHRQGLKGTSINGQIFMTGGHDGINYTDDILKFDGASMEWTHIGHMSLARNLHATSVVPLSEVESFCLS